MIKLASFTVRGWVSLGAVLLAGPALSLGCAGSPKAAAAPPKAPLAPPVVAESAPDLTPVAAPAELFALARFKQPKTALETLSAWANFPYKLHDVLPAELKDLESVIAWDAPLEAAAALDPLGEGKLPQPLSVVSVGLLSLEGALKFARAQGETVRRLSPGVYRIGDSDSWSCAAGVALGTAPARLVCGERERDVDGLFGYATRGLSTEAMPDVDFQIELRLAPVKTKYSAELGSTRVFAGFLLRELQLDEPRFDRALADVAYGLVDELTATVQDLDKVRLDASLDSAKSTADARIDLKFVSQKSWIVQASAESLDQTTPAPELFWQMPFDSTAASYSVGWKPERLKPIGHALAELLDAYWEAEKVSSPLRTQSTKTVEALFEQTTKQVRAQGELADAPSEPLLAADYKTFGWQLVLFDGPPKQLFTLLDGLTGLIGSRDLMRVLKERGVSIEAALIPKVAARAVTIKGYKPGARVYRVDMPKDLFAKLTKNFAGLESPMVKSKAPVKSVPLSLVVAYDGTRTTVGVSPDEKAVIKQLEALKDPKSPVLQARAGLEALRGTPHAAAGFVSVERFGGQLGALAGHSTDASRLISALPHHGQTPMLFSYDLHAEGPDLTATLSVPRLAIEDLGALLPALALMKNGGHTGLGGP